MATKQSEAHTGTPKEAHTELRKGGVAYNPPPKVDPQGRKFPVSKPTTKK
jgi:hypothetical protein